MAHRILLADDHALVRAGISNALAGLPDVQIVGEVGDGPSLAPALEQWQPDCLLIDVTMPDFEPIAEIRRIRARYPRLCILVVSAYDDDVYVQGLLGAGVNGYHLKDQPLSDLRLAVMRVLAGERWISSSLVDKLLHPKIVTAVPALSTRQQDILRLLADGLDNRAISQRLNLSVKTVENHLTRLYRQINVQSRLEAATYVRDHPELLARMGRATQQEPLQIVDPQAEQAVILVVDDNGRYRSQLRRIIGKIFPQTMIYEAGNTADAIHLAARVPPQIAFVDVVLGDEDGIRCTRRLRGQSPATRIVLISAYPDREFHRLGLEAGATAFVDKKDLDAATLQQIIADAIL
ncbi:MAG: response regulator transcription factor [Anaerolineae bacterium]|nr:response regulator transcription factor [Anaerolineae bacterium]